MLLLIIIVILLVLLGSLFVYLSRKSDSDHVAQVKLFYAPWCGHCQAIKPTWEKLEEEFPDYAVKVDCDANPDQAERYQIMGFPTIFYDPTGKNGDLVEYSGDRSYDSLKNFVLKSKESGSRLINISSDGETINTEKSQLIRK